MSSQTPESRHEERLVFDAGPARRSRGLRISAVLGLVSAIGAALTVGPGLAGPLAAALQVADTLRSADLRCLTRRPEDCLDRPVPRDEPHGAVCATCHNLWTPGAPANVTRSCTAAGCHAGASPLSVFHQTVHPEVLTDCVHCHKAHEFRVPANGDDCSACHKGGGTRVEWVTATARHGLAAPSAFQHADHGGVECARCHGRGLEHGTLAVVALQDCRACHHRAPLRRDCTRCHTPESLSGIALKVTRSLDIRIGSLDRPLRLLPFDHANHLDVGCDRCHTTKGSNLRAAAGADCSACHAQHHEPEADCSLCHQRPAAGAHDRQAHLGCSGTGCHDPAPEGIRRAPRTRALCLACHMDQREHKPAQICADCHRLPAPTGGHEPSFLRPR